MKCVNHPEVDATGTCVKCGKNLCVLCKHEYNNKTFCQPCSKEVLTQKADIPFTLANIERRNTKNFLGDEASKLSTAAKYCAVCGLLVLSVAGFSLFFGAATGNFSFTNFVLGISVTLFILATVFGVLTLFRHPSLSSCINAILGLLLSIIPLILILSVYIKFSQPYMP